ncbi:MAG TPA: glycosyltransferase [Parafilimonas sp.]|nr:glycosyltransferase [Parafilimonas sp.]
MKIFQIIPSLSDGGAERFVVDLCNQLAGDRHKVTLCSLFALEGSYQYFKQELLTDVELISLDKKPGFDISVIFKLKKILNKYRPDVIHTHVRALNYLLPILMMDTYNVIHTVHNDANKEIANDRERRVRYWFYQKKKVIPVTISNESDRTFKHVYPNVTSTVIYNGTRKPAPSTQFETIKRFFEDTRHNNAARIFVHIGRLKNQKNHLLLISAFKKLLEDGVNALLIMIGAERDGEESRQIALAIKKACAGTRNIIWIGGNQPATDYLMLADFFCLSSIYEGMPISLIEAFATGCLPICTPVGAIPEMMDGNDFLATGTTEDAYYRALATAYASPKEKLIFLRDKFMTLFNEKYAMKHCANSYEQLYKDLLCKNGI